MSMRKLSRWVVLIVVGCNGKLSVSDGDDGGAGTAGAGGRAGTAAAGGRAGSAGKPPLEELAGMAGVPDIEGGFGGDVGIGAGGSGASGGSGPIAGSGGTIIAPGPGTVGQNCVPGALLTEADGSPAKAVIKTLASCNEGLSCNAQGKCVTTPDCPQSSGSCVLRRAELGGSGGVGGTDTGPAAGGPNDFPSYGGDGNLLPPTTVEEIGVVALTANESHVDWVEYGTRNALGTYQHDGKLLSYSIADGTTTTMASGLEGPIGLGLTTTHAYVYVDGGRLIGTPTHPQLLRVPLAGGSPTLVQEGTLPTGFVAVGSQAFWSKGNQIYSMTADSNAVPTVLAGDNGYPWTLAGDATDLYYSALGGTLVRVPVTSAAAISTGLAAGEVALHDDGIFRVEPVDAAGLLSRAPKTGGEFERVRALGAGYPSALQAVGDRYFLRVFLEGILGPDGRYYSETQVLTADFVGSDPPIRLLARRSRGAVIDRLWAGTAGALYWSEGRAIYKQPLPTP